MAINRFSRGPIAADVQSSFMPMPLDLIDRQIQRRQTQYDKAKATISGTQEAMYGAKGLSMDRESLGNITSGYDKDIDTAIEKAGGDYSKLTSYSDQLATKVGRDMKTGHLGAIHNNFVRAQNHMQVVDKDYKEGKISKAGRDKAYSSISGFGGTTEDGKGGYTKTDLYSPAKYIDLVNTSDTYAAKINDQYLQSGERYINSKTAAGHVYKNLYNNPQAIENAKEQVWSMYGDLPPEKEQIAVQSYLKSQATDAGNKISFQQRFKADGNTDPLSGGATGTTEIQSEKPMFAKVKIGGLGLGEAISRIQRKELANKAGVMGENVGQIMKSRWGFGDKPNFKPVDTESVYKDLADTPVLVDIAKQHGIDISDPTQGTLEKLENLEEILKTYDDASASTRVDWVIDKDTKEKFDNSITQIAFPRYTIYDMESGEEVESDRKFEMLNNHRDQQSKANIEFGGEIPSNSVDQYYPPGTKVFGIMGTEGSYAIIPNEIKNQSFMANKIKQAYTNKYSEYYDGRGQIQMINAGDGTVKIYRDGEFTGERIDLTK